MMTNENDTEPLTTPPPEETDPDYAGRTGERVSYGAISHRGSEAHLRTDPNFLTALKEKSVEPPKAAPLPPVVVAESAKPAGKKDDSIDELIDGLPLDASLPKKLASSAPPKAAPPSAPLPAVILDVKTEPPQLRKGRVDNSTVVTPAGLELQTQRWVTLGIAVAIGLGILLWMLNWSAGPSHRVPEPGITTTEARHVPTYPPPPPITGTTMAPAMPALDNPPAEGPAVTRSPPTSASASAPSASARPPRAPSSADINEFKPSIRH